MERHIPHRHTNTPKNTRKTDERTQNTLPVAKVLWEQRKQQQKHIDTYGDYQWL